MNNVIFVLACFLLAAILIFAAMAMAPPWFTFAVCAYVLLQNGKAVMGTIEKTVSNRKREMAHRKRAVRKYLEGEGFVPCECCGEPRQDVRLRQGYEVDLCDVCTAGLDEELKGGTKA